MAKNLYLAGVGGWLRFLIILLMIIGPLIWFGNLSNDFYDTERQFPQLLDDAQWSNYKLVSRLIFVISVAISFSAGYRLWKIHFSESVRFAILALWLSGPLGNLMYFVAAVFIFGLQAGAKGLPDMLSGILGSSIGAGIWTAYLMRSLRVKNTYQASLSAQNRGTTSI